MNVGLLLLHGFVGAALFAHGLQKVIQFRPSGTAAYLDSLGLRAAPLLALVVIGNELGGGLLLGLGLLTPLGALLVAGTMLVASRTDHRGKGWWITGLGSEYVITNAIVAVALVATGPGRFSLDRAFGLKLAGPWWAAGVAAAALLGAGVVLAAFRRPAPALEARAV